MFLLKLRVYIVLGNKYDILDKIYLYTPSQIYQYLACIELYGFTGGDIDGADGWEWKLGVFLLCDM